MRLRGIKTIEEGNKFLEEYLPIYNRKFSVKAKEESNFHREIPKGMKIDRILCIKTERKVRNDFTISYNSRLYQILDKTSAQKVQVVERINGTMVITHMVITHNDTCLKFKEITERPERVQNKAIVFVLKKKTNYIPPANHPWRRFKLVIQNNNYQQQKPTLIQT